MCVIRQYNYKGYVIEYHSYKVLSPGGKPDRTLLGYRAYNPAKGRKYCFSVGDTLTEIKTNIDNYFKRIQYED